MIDGEATAEKRLAQSLETDEMSFVETFGAGWREVPTVHDHDADPSGEFDDLYGPWYVSGDPAQLMMRVTLTDLEVATPRGRWLGHQLVLVPGETATLSRTGWSASETRGVVGQLLRKRRSSFSYCRYCRSLTPPELRTERDVCMDCASRWHGVIY